jgi:enoyl-CoA hydratase
MDLKALAKGELGCSKHGGFAGLVEAPPKKPLIAAVQGYALGGGFEIAMSCDLIVAASDAKFGLPEVKRGLIADSGGLLRLPAQLPYRIAMELILTGELVTADVLACFGLVNRVVASADVMPEARRLALTIAENAPLAVSISKEIVRNWHDGNLKQMFASQKDGVAAIMHSEDALEGPVAFAQKRKPIWKGR